MSDTKKKYISIPLIYIFIVAIISLYQITAISRVNSYYSDEFFSFFLTENTKLSEYFTTMVDIGNPPLYFFLLDIYLSLSPFLKTEFNVRFLSLLFLAVSVVFIHKLTQNLFKSKYSQLFALTLFLLADPTITYFGLARPYPLYWTIFIVSLYLMTKKSSSNKSITMLGIMLILGMLTHYVFFISAFCFFVYSIYQKNKALILTTLTSLIIGFGLSASNIHSALLGKYYRYDFWQLSHKPMVLIDLVKSALFQEFVSDQAIIILTLMIAILIIKKVKQIKLTPPQKGLLIIAFLQYIVFYLTPLSRVFPLTTYRLTAITLFQLALVTLLDVLLVGRYKKLVLSLCMLLSVLAAVLSKSYVFAPEVKQVRSHISSNPQTKSGSLEIACFENMEPYFSYYLPSYDFDCHDNSILFFQSKKSL